MFSIFSDEFFMEQALKEAILAFEKDEVPVGAVVVCENRIIARAHNLVQTLNDNTAHAEILAITSASNYLGSKYLNDCTMYVSLEPCPMCAGAIYWSRLQKLVYGAADNKLGFMRFGKKMLHPKTKLEYGILEAEGREIMKRFFQNKRD